MLVFYWLVQSGTSGQISTSNTEGQILPSQKLLLVLPIAYPAVFGSNTQQKRNELGVCGLNQITEQSLLMSCLQLNTRSIANWS